MTGYHSRTSAIVHGETLRASMQDRWWESAACKGTPLAIWEPECNLPDRIKDHRARLCGECPVFAQCRREAELTDDALFRAGESQYHRRIRTGQRAS